ncbi:MAG: DoxX family protein [Planctomycetaceae bacterium]
MSKSRLAGWVLSGLLAAMLIVASAGGKFTEWEGKAEAFTKLGWSTEVMLLIGYVEVVVTLLFLIPRTSFLGAILLTAYLGGATATHVRVDDAFYMPIVIGVLVWIALGLRNPVIFALVIDGRCKAAVGPADSGA